MRIQEKRTHAFIFHYSKNALILCPMMGASLWSTTMRMRHRSLSDPRFIGGIVLIIFSVVAASLFLHRATHGEDMYVSIRDIAAGEEITVGDMRVIPAQLGEITSHYLGVGDLKKNAVATSRITKGEFIPTSAIGTMDDISTRPLALSLSQPLPAAAKVGTYVQLWEISEQGSSQSPQMVSAHSVLLRLPKEKRNSLRGQETDVDIRVPETDIEAVLEAQGEGKSLVAVPENK